MTTRQPWMKWYPADWRADPGLRMCSFAARGIWADMLALMHEAEPYGYLLVNGRAPTMKQLALLLGGDEREVAVLVEELESAGVFSRSDDGTVISRRMVRDCEKRERDKANGRTGGNPDLIPPVNRGVNPPANPQVNGVDKAQKPETRVPESEEENNNNPGKRKNGAHPPIVFAHGCVRLSAEDLAKWEAAFPAVSVKSELMAAEPWLAKQPNWFVAAAGLLAKRQREATRQTGPPSQPAVPPIRHPRDGF